MFDVQHEDDAWELGVLFVNDFIHGSGPELGVPEHLQKFFNAGCSDARNLSDLRVEQIAMSWGLPVPDKQWQD